MRTTKDLIDELDYEKSHFWVVALAVGFERTTTFIFAHEQNRWQKLNQAVSDGGEPIGLIAFNKEQDGSATCHSRVLVEHAHEQGAKDYLDRLIDSFAITLGVDRSKVQKQKGWLN
jgi:hypothetical protein